MKFDESEFLVNYLTKGYYHFNASSALKSFDLGAFLPMKSGDRRFESNTPLARYEHYNWYQRHQLRQLAINVGNAYFSSFNHKFHFNDMWSTVGMNVGGWHNDLMLAWPGFNTSFNCYFDDTSEETGGQFQSHPYQDVIPEDSLLTEGAYPKALDIIVINQNTNFVHRVSHSDKQRRMISFAAAFYDFNPVLGNKP